jgi:hypothetical protein
MAPVLGMFKFPICPIALGIAQKARKLRLYGSSSWSDVLNGPIQSGHLTSCGLHSGQNEKDR